MYPCEVLGCVSSLVLGVQAKRVNEDLHMDAAAWSRLGETNTCVWEGEANLFTLHCDALKIFR